MVIRLEIGKRKQIPGPCERTILFFICSETQKSSGPNPMPLLSRSKITLYRAVRDSASATFLASKYANIGVMSCQYDSNQCRKTRWEPPGYTTVAERCWDDVETFPQRGQKRCLKRAINFSPPSTEDKHNEGAHSSPLSLMKQSITKLSNYKKKKKFHEGKAVVKHRRVTKSQLRTHQKQVVEKTRSSTRHQGEAEVGAH